LTHKACRLLFLRATADPAIDRPLREAPSICLLFKTAGEMKHLLFCIVAFFQQMPA
jgi:hypothetical protein